MLGMIANQVHGRHKTRRFWLEYGAQFRLVMLVITSFTSIVLTVLCAAGVPVHEGIVALIFLVLILLIAETFGFWRGLLAAVGCNLVLVYFFLEPRQNLWADNPQELLSLPLFLLASVIGGSLLQTSREFTRQAQAGQKRSNALLGLHRAMRCLWR